MPAENVMWLGQRRGYLVDWFTQKWVQATGRRVEPAAHAWLNGPAGHTHGIGPDFLDRWALDNGLRADRGVSARGLLPSFAELAGNGFDPEAVHPTVVEFYERTADFDLDLWSEWSGLFRPFGFLVAALFSRRLEQLNLPLFAMDASRGMSSEVVRLTDPTSGEVRHNFWVRTLVRTGRVAYVGGYSVTTIPDAAGPCVKTVFPLPNGNAVVIRKRPAG